MRGLAIAAAELVRVQWQVFRVCDDDAPVCEDRQVVTAASGWVMGGWAEMLCKSRLDLAQDFGRDESHAREPLVAPVPGWQLGAILGSSTADAPDLTTLLIL